MAGSILYLVPDLLGLKGGIAHYGRLVCQALSQSAFSLDVLSLIDRDPGDDSFANDMGINYQPCHGSRTFFVRQALATTLRHRPLIILVGHPNFSSLGWCLARISGAQLVVFIYGIDVFKPLAMNRRWALRRANQIISISQFTARQAVRTNRISPERIRILHNCLNPRLGTLTSSVRSEENLSMLTVGRLSVYEQYKGHDYVIRSMPALLARFPNLIYHIVGDGDWRPTLERLAEQTQVSHAVRFHGMVSEESLMQHYANADVFIMPSRGEGFGFVFLEAMAHAKPVIGGNVDATPEVIVDGVTGYLVNPTSVESIVDAASQLLGNAELRRQMGQAAVQHVNQNFGFDKFKHQLNAYLAELKA